MNMKHFSFKKLFWSYTFCGIPFSLLQAFLALFHVAPSYINQTAMYGLTGFVVPILFIPVFSVLLSGINWLVLNFGAFLHEAFLKMIGR